MPLAVILAGEAPSTLTPGTLRIFAKELTRGQALSWVGVAGRQFHRCAGARDVSGVSVLLLILAGIKNWRGCKYRSWPGVLRIGLLFSGDKKKA